MLKLLTIRRQFAFFRSSLNDFERTSINVCLHAIVFIGIRGSCLGTAQQSFLGCHWHQTPLHLSLECLLRHLRTKLCQLVHYSPCFSQLMRRVVLLLPLCLSGKQFVCTSDHQTTSRALDSVRMTTPHKTP